MLVGRRRTSIIIRNPSATWDTRHQRSGNNKSKAIQDVNVATATGNMQRGAARGALGASSSGHNRGLAGGSSGNDQASYAMQYGNAGANNGNNSSVSSKLNKIAEPAMSAGQATAASIRSYFSGSGLLGANEFSDPSSSGNGNQYGSKYLMSGKQGDVNKIGGVTNSVGLGMPAQPSYKQSTIRNIVSRGREGIFFDENAEGGGAGPVEPSHEGGNKKGLTGGSTTVAMNNNSGPSAANNAVGLLSNGHNRMQSRRHGGRRRYRQQQALLAGNNGLDAGLSGGDILGGTAAVLAPLPMLGSSGGLANTAFSALPSQQSYGNVSLAPQGPMAMQQQQQAQRGRQGTQTTQQLGGGGAGLGNASMGGPAMSGGHQTGLTAIAAASGANALPSVRPQSRNHHNAAARAGHQGQGLATANVGDSAQQGQSSTSNQHHHQYATLAQTQQNGTASGALGAATATAAPQGLAANLQGGGGGPLRDSLAIYHEDHCPNAAVTSIKGLKPGNPAWRNQDNFFVIDNVDGRDLHMYCAFDGHGEHGHHVSRRCRELFPQFLKTSNYELKRAFLGMQTDLCSCEYDVRCSGATCVLAILHGKQLTVANCGDSRAVIARRNGNGAISGHPLTTDHKPDNVDERKRIVACGGQVGCRHVLVQHGRGHPVSMPVGPCRVWYHNRVGETLGLAMSRSLGDAVAHKCGVSAEPEVFEHALDPSDEFVVIATDGVFDVLDNQQVVQIAFNAMAASISGQSSSNNNNTSNSKTKPTATNGLLHSAAPASNWPLEAANNICRFARSKWERLSPMIDDITCIVVALKR